jgi:hypothetical protein
VEIKWFLNLNFCLHALQKRKVADEVSSKPTDSLTKASVSDSSNNKGTLYPSFTFSLIFTELKFLKCS